MAIPGMGWLSSFQEGLPSKRSLLRGFLKGGLFVGFGLLTVGAAAAVFAGLAFGTFGVGVPIAIIFSILAGAATASALYGGTFSTICAKIDEKWPPDAMPENSEQFNETHSETVEKTVREEKPDEASIKIEKADVSRIEATVDKDHTDSFTFKPFEATSPTKQNKNYADDGNYQFNAENLSDFKYTKQGSDFSLHLPKNLDLEKADDKAKAEQAIAEILKHIYLATNSKAIVLDFKDEKLLAIAQEQCNKLGFTIHAMKDEQTSADNNYKANPNPV